MFSSLIAGTTFLIVGNSLVSPTLPMFLQNSAAIIERNIDVQYQVINGSPLGWNWDHSSEAEGSDGRKLLASGDVAYLVLSDSVPFCHVQADWNETVDHATKWYDLALSANPDARVYLYELWHDLRSGQSGYSENSCPGEVDWRERIDLSRPDFEYVVDQVNARRASSGGAPMELVPVGSAFGYLRDEINRGVVPGVAKIDDFFADTIHPNDLGWYYINSVYLASILGPDAVGGASLSRDRDSASIAPELAVKLKEIAVRAVALHR